jgi:DNA-binding transcriptional regulator LsrR (DeoR family)
VSQVRRALQRALTDEAQNGITQSEIARRIDVHRSVINREMRGAKDITHGRVGELAWAMGYEPVFKLERVQQGAGANAAPVPPQADPTNAATAVNLSANDGRSKTINDGVVVKLEFAYAD